MVTGLGDENLATQVLRAGALDYVVKDRALAYLMELPKRVYESVTRHRLQQLNALLIEAFESARDGVMIGDLQGRILHANRALENMFGYARQEMLGQTPQLFQVGDEPPEFLGSVLSRNSWQGELINKRKDGSLVDTSLTLSPILDNHGRLTHVVGIYRDISERRQMERQLFQAQKMQSVGTLAGGIAHEFNNLLAGIQGYATLGLREENVPEPLHEFLGHIVSLTDRAANLTRQLLAFARKPALSKHVTSIVKLLQSTAEFVRHTLSLDVTLDVPAADSVPLLAAVDANQMQQVLVNLTLNARDAMRSPQAVIYRLRHVQAAAEMLAFPQNVPPGDYVLIEVEDLGCGMSPEVLGQALDPFYTTKDVGQGSGLGLPVAFGIVQGHQGYLTVDSELGRGTCLGIYLPRSFKPEPPGPPPAFEPGQILEPDTMPGRSILVIDDEEAVLYIVRRFLEIAGHTVTCVTSSAFAFEVLKRDPIDLVICDLMIPREDSFSTVRTIREMHPDMPVLLCTGLLQAERVGDLTDLPHVSLLRKPFRMNELWYAVNKLLEPA
jgi:PAS domain S-box-containing protein